MTGADDSDVIDIGGIDQVAMASLPTAFPTDVDEGIIVQVGCAGERRIFIQTNNGASSDLHAADEIVAGRDEDIAAAVYGAGIERFLKSDGILGGAIADGAKIADVKGFGS